LKRLAFVYGVIIVEDARLAQALYRASAMEREVPELFYHEIAKIYLDIRAIQKARGGEQ
jgi:flagellar biosynthesis protein FlhB